MLGSAAREEPVPVPEKWGHVSVVGRPRTLNNGKEALPGGLVTGADYRALGIVRSLGRRGVPVLVLRGGNEMLAATSRYACGSLSWSGGNESEKADFLAHLATSRRLKGWALFPTDDEAVGIVARHHASLSEHFRLTIPPWEKLRWLCDKRLLHILARDLGIDQPRTFCPHARQELTSLDCAFPAIVKPTLRETSNPLTIQKAWRVDDRQSLLDRYEEATRLLHPGMILVQELVPGSGETQFSYAALCQDGHPLAWLVARRTRQFPMDFGRFSTYVETVDEPGVIEPAVRLLKSIRYSGLVEIEFKRDPRDGRYKLLDVNPRVWGWHTLGSPAGVDFAYLVWRMVHGEPVPEIRGRAGLRWRMASRDRVIAVQEILRGRLSIRRYLRSLSKPTEPAIFASDDPLPWLIDLPVLGYRLGQRLLRQGRV